MYYPSDEAKKLAGGFCSLLEHTTSPEGIQYSYPPTDFYYPTGNETIHLLSEDGTTLYVTIRNDETFEDAVYTWDGYCLGEKL